MKPIAAHLPAVPSLPEVLLPYYEAGKLAGATGRSQDECSLRRQDRRAAWLRGWHDGQVRPARPPVLTEPEQTRLRAGIAACRAALEKTNP